MRLTPKEQQAILSSITSLDKDVKVYLYGSRTNDKLKGGDIDLLVISEKLSFSDKITILTSIKDQIGEQKIDLTIANQKKAKEDPFVKSILPNSVEIKI